MHVVVVPLFLIFVLVVATLLVLKFSVARKSKFLHSVRMLFEGNAGGWMVSGVLALALVTFVVVFHTLPPMPEGIRNVLRSLTSESYFGGGLTVFELLTMCLAVVGAVFAILARIDARSAFKASKDLQDALTSFRSSFKSIMKEIPAFIDRSRKGLSIMIPTPMYGYVFKEREAALLFMEALTRKLTELGLDASEMTTIKLILINSGNGQRQSKLYLQLANALGEGEEQTFKDNTKLFLQAFKSAAANTKKYLGRGVEVRMLSKYDPHVRLFVAEEFVLPDLQVVHREGGQVMVVFTQSDISNADPNVEFKATAFMSTNREMVESLGMLFNLYWEDAEPVDLSQNDFIQEFSSR